MTILSSGNITCRLTYRRIDEASSSSDKLLASVGDRESEEGLNSDIHHRNTNRPVDTTKDEIGNYTRVHVMSRSPGPPPPPSPPFPPYQVVTKPCPRCGAENEVFNREEIKWSVPNRTRFIQSNSWYVVFSGNVNCRIYYQRIDEMACSSNNTWPDVLESDSEQEYSSVITSRDTNTTPIPAPDLWWTRSWTCDHCGAGLQNARFNSHCTCCMTAIGYRNPWI